MTLPTYNDGLSGHCNIAESNVIASACIEVDKKLLLPKVPRSGVIIITAKHNNLIISLPTRYRLY